jgi:hypothetical protein
MGFFSGDNTNKICIVGGLIQGINTLSFYLNGIEGFINQSWTEFKANLLTFVLPVLWRTKLRNQIHKLSMGDLKTFLSYSTRAWTSKHGQL